MSAQPIFDEAGFAGLSELAVAMLIAAILMPFVGLGLTNGYQLLVSLTTRATVTATSGQVLTTAEQQLQGAQPLGYCVTAPGVQQSGGDPGNPASVIETPLVSCTQTALGPIPPSGSVSWSSYVQLPSPSLTSCGSPQLTQGALVAATATCVGYFSYDYEASGSESASAGALSGSGPYTSPELTYLWVCSSSCPNNGESNTLWVTYYEAKGSYTNAGCPSPTASCTSANWAGIVPLNRYVGQLAIGSTKVFGYRDTSGSTGSTVTLSQTLTPPGVSVSDLQNVVVVTVTAAFAYPPAQSVTSTVSVPVTGNIYQATSSGDG
jgi:hypothetical protein